MSTYDRATRCPWCNRAHEAHTLVAGDEGEPDEGAISVCIGCEWPAVFTSDGIRRPTIAELEELRLDPRFRELAFAKGQAPS